MCLGCIARQHRPTTSIGSWFTLWTVTVWNDDMLSPKMQILQNHETVQWQKPRDIRLWNISPIFTYTVGGDKSASWSFFLSTWLTRGLPGNCASAWTTATAELHNISMVKSEIIVMMSKYKLKAALTFNCNYCTVLVDTKVVVLYFCLTYQSDSGKAATEGEYIRSNQI